MLKPILALLLSGSAVEAQDAETLSRHALDLVNEARQEQGLGSLALGDDLEEAAQAHAADMLERDFYAHVSPEGDDVADRYTDAGGSEWELVAENIARCIGCDVPADLQRVDAFQEGWMNSPGHRANILAEGLERFGFATASDDRTVYAVQTFAGPGTSRGEEPGRAVDSQAAAELALQRINAARKENGLKPLQLDRGLQQAAAELIPADLQGFALDDLDNLGDALPEDALQGWRRIQTMGSTCGGCGTEPVEGDVRAILGDWLDSDSPYRQQILQEGLTDAGMILRANGQGRKVALLLLGEAL
ncbi:MAG: CAP domain-containing protein [Pseudomonadota bacterium]|nr:CAP domain-containing protein [Pseudomonadota bacterium]